MKSVANLTGNEMDGKQTLREKISRLFTSFGNEVHTEKYGTVFLSNASIRSDIRHGSTRNKNNLNVAIPDVLKNGVTIDISEKNNGEVTRVIVAAPITISNTPYFMGVMIQRDANTNRLYLHDVVIQKEASEYQTEHLNTTGPVSIENLYTTEVLEKAASVGYSILQNKGKVNNSRDGDADVADFIEDVVEDEDGNIHENVVVVDTDIFKNKKPRNFKEALIDYVYNNLAGKPFLAKDNYGNDVTIEFAKINERVQKDGASRAHRAIDKLARKNDRNSQFAVAQARELIYVSKESGGNSEHKHQWLDANGWEYRTAKMQLPSGEIYEVTLNIGQARDGRNILYDINQIKNIGRASLPESGNDSGNGSHTNSDADKSIPQNQSVVNPDIMSFIEDIEGDEGYVTSAELEANAKKHINARSSNEITDMGIRKMARETKTRRIFRRIFACLIYSPI